MFVFCIFVSPFIFFAEGCDEHLTSFSLFMMTLIMAVNFGISLVQYWIVRKNIVNIKDIYKRVIFTKIGFNDFLTILIKPETISDRFRTDELAFKFFLKCTRIDYKIN